MIVTSTHVHGILAPKLQMMSEVSSSLSYELAIATPNLLLASLLVGATLSGNHADDCGRHAKTWKLLFVAEGTLLTNTTVVATDIYGALC